MNIFRNIIEFKSENSFFILEQNGKKPNTVRLLNYTDYRRVVSHEREFETIRIVNTIKNGNPDDEEFEREITDISVVGTFLGHKIVVFSWRHKE